MIRGKGQPLENLATFDILTYDLKQSRSRRARTNKALMTDDSREYRAGCTMFQYFGRTTRLNATAHHYVAIFNYWWTHGFVQEEREIKRS